ncbi:HAD family hydrolase [Spongiibacter nanhainus]|uniref:HAD family hydrolase n=1 Tax=Spongiibacter nanhainus TaxID=2794344 RepID=A0A7T4R0T3_9GAMM|nr:HAD family hydrolase [Spongiibacter nanhainus]QQD18222.1 HAD family hydrolase [Spongiibacter nanhainus]
MIFFDLDDTLMDHSGAEDAALQEFAKQFAPASDNQFFGRWKEASHRHMLDYLAGKISFQEQRRRRISDTLKADLAEAEADKIFSTYLKAYEQNWALFPEVLPTLERLQSKGLGVITNGSITQQNQKIEALGLRAYFAHIITSEDASVAKPEAAIFHYACEVAGVDASHACYVGDRLEQDALAALDAGFGQAVHIDRSGRQSKAVGMVVGISNLSELSDAIAA